MYSFNQLLGIPGDPTWGPEPKVEKCPVVILTQTLTPFWIRNAPPTEAHPMKKVAVHQREALSATLSSSNVTAPWSS